jgi:hypothetical protein
MFRGPDFSVKMKGEFYKTAWTQATAFMSLMRMNVKDKHAFYSLMRIYLMDGATKMDEPPSNGFLDFDKSLMKGKPLVLDKDGKETDYYNEQYDQWMKRLGNPGCRRYESPDGKD